MATTLGQEQHIISKQQALIIGKAMKVIADGLNLLTIDVIDAMHNDDCLTESQYDLIWRTVQEYQHEW